MFNAVALKSEITLNHDTGIGLLDLLSYIPYMDQRAFTVRRHPERSWASCSLRSKIVLSSSNLQWLSAAKFVSGAHVSIFLRDSNLGLASVCGLPCVWPIQFHLHTAFGLLVDRSRTLLLSFAIYFFTDQPYTVSTGRSAEKQ